MKNKLFGKLAIATAILTAASNAGVSAQAPHPERIYLSGTGIDNTKTWEFFCSKGQNSGKWEKIEVPCNWELQGFGAYTYGRWYKVPGEKPSDEIGTYRLGFDAPETWKGQRVKIYFDGVMTDTEVTVNGKPAGEMHQGGFNRFSYDITGLLTVDRSIKALIDTEPLEDAKKPPEQIVHNVNDLLDSLLEQSVALVGKPVALMNKEEKVAAIQFLNDAGAFLITKSGDKVCKFFGISKYTLYSYIDPRVVRFSLVALITCLSYGCIQAFMTSFAAERNLTPAASLFFLLYALMALVTRPLTGRLFDLRGENIIFYPALLLTALSLTLIAHADSSWMLLLAGLVLGAGFGNFQSAGQAVSLSLVSRSRFAQATTTFFIFFDLGIGLGPYIFGFLVPSLGYGGMYQTLAVVVLTALVAYYLLHGRDILRQKG